jgi:hypothetical protein
MTQFLCQDRETDSYEEFDTGPNPVLAEGQATFIPLTVGQVTGLTHAPSP